MEKETVYYDHEWLNKKVFAHGRIYRIDRIWSRPDIHNGRYQFDLIEQTKAGKDRKRGYRFLWEDSHLILATTPHLFY